MTGMNEPIRERNNRIRLYIANGIIVTSALIALIFGTGWVKEGLVAAQAAESYEVAKEDFVSSKSHDINFSALHKVGADIVSWIYLPGTGIDYPLVRGTDNDYYINHDAYGNESTAGAIFMNYTNAADLTDPKTVIFGHNMRDGSMFSHLHNYESMEYGREHSDCYIYLDDGTVNHYKLRLYIFTDPSENAVYLVSPTDETAEGAAMALYNCADMVYDSFLGNNIICLSTCTYHTYRTVVVFEFVDHQKPISGVSDKMAEQGMNADSLKDADNASKNAGRVGSVAVKHETAQVDNGSVSSDNTGAASGGLRGVGGLAAGE